VLLSITYSITWKFLKRMGAIRINETYWFVPIRNDPIGDYIDEETEKVLFETKVVSFQLSIRFGFVFEGIGIAKSSFLDPLAAIADVEKGEEKKEPEKEEEKKIKKSMKKIKQQKKLSFKTLP